MAALLDFMLYRMIYLGAIAVGLIILVFVAMVILKKLGLWHRTRELAEPFVRQQLKNRGGVSALIEKQLPVNQKNGDRS
ncbi:hypothetical protein [Fodinicola feengrottensis]|uniref:Uncharacterized protein n=1 Tax=Fodinicola feengrottensis TaxID=435914 RepID=A0ABN2H044_9ACTN|nr:hypothetical protein [Fodinicola feengrottensis]